MPSNGGYLTTAALTTVALVTAFGGDKRCGWLTASRRCQSACPRKRRRWTMFNCWEFFCMPFWLLLVWSLFLSLRWSWAFSPALAVARYESVWQQQQRFNVLWSKFLICFVGACEETFKSFQIRCFFVAVVVVVA